MYRTWWSHFVHSRYNNSFQISFPPWYEISHFSEKNWICACFWKLSDKLSGHVKLNWPARIFLLQVKSRRGTETLQKEKWLWHWQCRNFLILIKLITKHRKVRNSHLWDSGCLQNRGGAIFYRGGNNLWVAVSRCNCLSCAIQVWFGSPV